jgi:hypothetical protein
LKNIRYSSFSYQSQSNSQPPTITMEGQAVSFSDVALQAQEFQKEENKKYLSSVVISNPNLDQKGNVIFSLSGTIIPQAFYFSQIASGNQQGVTLTQSVQPATSTPTKKP